MDNTSAVSKPVADSDRTAPGDPHFSAMDASTNDDTSRYEDAAAGQPEAGGSPEVAPTSERLLELAVLKFKTNIDAPSL